MVGNLIPRVCTQYNSPRIIVGTNSDWRDPNLPAILYDYFLKKYQSDEPPKSYFNLKNVGPNEKHSFQVYVARSAGRGDIMYGQGRVDYTEDFTFYIYVRKKSIGETFYHLDNIESEVKRIMFEHYETMNIAGIQRTGPYRRERLMGPKSNYMNSAPESYCLPCTITVYYATQAPIIPKSLNGFQTRKYYAGAFTDEF